MTNGTNPMGRARAARLIFSVCALGEMSFGVLCLVFPQLLAVVMNASLDSMGLLVTRMLGVGVLGLLHQDGGNGFADSASPFLASGSRGGAAGTSRRGTSFRAISQDSSSGTSVWRLCFWHGRS